MILAMPQASPINSENRRRWGRPTATLSQVVKDGDLRLHPIVTKLVDGETLEKMGVTRGSAGHKTEITDDR